MKITGFYQKIIGELNQATSQIQEDQAKDFIELIQKANKVFLAGAGRSGLASKAFAMRLMHMGVDAYVVGETNTAPLEEGDLLVVGSGSGETKSLIPIVDKAKDLGGQVALVSINKKSAIGDLSDLVVELPGATKDQSNKDDISTIQPMGSLFEQTLLVFFDAVILKYMELNHLETDKMYGKHANLE